tara:strand:- start:694 stop:1320 length:627 start_codon:yes stop_codon:yes gene_type:complete
MDHKFIIGKKIGMSRIFSDSGLDVPITVIQAGPCPVTQIKNIKIDGYESVQIGFDDVSLKKSNKPIIGHCSKSNSKPKRVMKEFRVNKSKSYELGAEITVSAFNPGDFVSITGKSKGKGFAGHMKRHGFGGGRRSHGKNSVMRKAGSIGAGSDPSRVWKGTRMAGRLGNDRVKISNLEVVKVNIANNLVYIKGSIPGAINGIVYLEAK